MSSRDPFRHPSSRNQECGVIHTKKMLGREAAYWVSKSPLERCTLRVHFLACAV